MDSALVVGCVLGVSIALQLLAAGLALRLIPLSNARLAWVLISVALVLMSARRAIPLWRLAQGGSRPAIDPSAELVALAISAALAVGMYLIAELFTERRRLEEQLRQAEKLEALGHLAGGIAHDFNNQLLVIMGHADELARSVEDPELRASADLILTTAQRSASLTRNLLAFARKGTQTARRVDMHALIGEVEALLRRTLAPCIEIRRDLRAEPATVCGDPAQLQNVLLNLAINARDAMPSGGSLTFSTQLVVLGESEARQRHRDLGPGWYVAVAVADTGTGIDAPTRAHLFEPFFTTKPEGEGTGLGLASVYGTVRSHHGAVEVDSAPGRGSTFRVLLPLAADLDRAARAADAEPPRPDPPRERRNATHVLVVEDEPGVRDVLVSMLRRLGHEATACADSAQAVEHYRRSWREIDLVILDTIMPRLGGAETLAALAGINPDVRVVVCSGYGPDRPPDPAFGASVVGYLHKPFAPAELSETLSRALPPGSARP